MLWVAINVAVFYLVGSKKVKNERIQKRGHSINKSQQYFKVIFEVLKNLKMCCWLAFLATDLYISTDMNQLSTH